MGYEHNTTTFLQKEFIAIFAKFTHVPENIPHLNHGIDLSMVSIDRYRERCPDGAVTGDGTAAGNDTVTSGPQHRRQPRPALVPRRRRYRRQRIDGID